MNIRADQSRGLLRSFVRIATTESPRTLFRGIGVVASGAGPAHALYFSCYETTKNYLSGNNRSNVLAQGERPLIIRAGILTAHGIFNMGITLCHNMSYIDIYYIHSFRALFSAFNQHIDY